MESIKNNGLFSLMVELIFPLDPMAKIMLLLVGFISTCIASFSFRYLKGDTHYGSFFFYLFCLVFSLGVLVSTDHLAYFFVSWCTSNLLLVQLMVHKATWKAAKYSGLLAFKNYLWGALCIGISLVMIHYATEKSTISSLTHSHFTSPLITPALLLLLIGAMTQSAIWPFHRWLISSLNSPTPASAMMHAGLVNGGGFLLVRFAPLYLDRPLLLTLIFTVGMITAFIGTLWKLLQNDVKRMLACSTMGQMGFMLVQCGLGLFPAAVAHLVTHALFKAYLFLASGSAAQEKRYTFRSLSSMGQFGASLLCGFLGSYCFSLASGKPWVSKDTNFVLIIITFLTASQASLPILSLKKRFQLILACFVISLLSLAYGGILYGITKMIEPMSLLQPQPLNSLHITGILVLVVSWLSPFLFTKIQKIPLLQSWLIKGYVTTLNASQPHPQTITAHRNHYKYL